MKAKNKGYVDLKNRKKAENRYTTGLKQWIEVLPFIGIPLVLFTVFVLYPQIKNLYIATTDYSILPGTKHPFIGLANFKKIFTDITVKGSDGYYFWLSFRNSILAVLVTVPGQMILGVLAAVMVHRVRVCKNIYKVILYVAVICDWVVVANIFEYIFSSDSGSLANFILLHLHIISEPISWFSNTWTANAVIWIATIWKGFGWVMIIYLAALTGVPRDLYEVARIDGANFWKSFFYITIPCTKATIFYLIVNLINGAMNIFIQVFLLTEGGPLGTTDVMLDYIYTRAFNYFEFSYAAACGIFMGVFVFIVSMILKKKMGYGKTEY